ncbi:MAG: hypothetical protein IH613_00790 [Desulfuromonadales bacterium]|nr:hypothetical protein [Desulfuromonadales bacterium]
MIPHDLLTKYDLPAPEAALAIEDAISGILSRAFNKDIMVNVGEELEVVALDDRRIDPATLSRQLKRQIRYQIERELEKRQSLREQDYLRSLRGQIIFGDVRKVSTNGDLTIALEVEDRFRSLILTGICPARQVPPHERGCLHIGAKKLFLITSVLPVMEKDKAKVLIRLSRTSKTLPEILLREKAGEPSIRCRRRIAGAFSEIETSQRISKESIQSVSDELGERIIVRVVASQKEV